MINKKIYIILFIILYVFVALVSGIHGFAFFSLANTSLLAIMLAIAFEIGQAAVLFSILTDTNQRKKVMPWFLMGILTLVQIMGNVYNSYKYLITHASDNLKFFKEPIFIWTQLPDAEANVILSYIQGAILPIVALLLTSIVAGLLNKSENEEIEYVEDFPDEEDEPSDEGEDEGELEQPRKNVFGKISEKIKNISKKEPQEVIESIEEPQPEEPQPEELQPEEQEEIPLNDIEEKQDEYVENLPEEPQGEEPEITQVNESVPEELPKSHFINM